MVLKAILNLSHPDSKAVLTRVNFLFAHMHLTIAYITSGREEEAGQQAEELLRLDPTFSLKQWAETVPIKDRVELERFVADLRKAGLN